MRHATLVVCGALAAIPLAGCDMQPDGGVQEAPPTTEVPAAEPEQPPAAPTADVVLNVDEQPELGSYVTDAEGRALYMFTADTAGQSTCYEQCAEAWPPLLTQDSATAGVPTVQADLIGTTTRRTGEMQVTYGGYPLYYFAQDTMPGQVAGQDVQGFGGEWYLVTPDGQVLEAPAGGGEAGP